MSPVDKLSRIAAQLAPFTIVERMPYFLNNPFSCAITIGEQSVSAIIPKRMSLTSGAPLAGTLPAQPAGRFPSSNPAPEICSVPFKNVLRLETDVFLPRRTIVSSMLFMKAEAMPASLNCIQRIREFD